MRYILIIASVILLASPLFGNSHKVENLFGWHTSSGVQLRKFGDNDTHPVYNGEAENGQPHGMGIMTFPDGRKYIGEYKNGKRHGLGTISYVKGERKGEKYMSAAMKKHFLAVLIDWREHLKEEMQKTFDHLKNKGESYADPIDRASQEEEFAFELRTRDRERKLISKIAMSLEQIKQDDYGYCYACGIEIGVKRLEARPTATHCIDCKTLDEIKEKQLGG